MWLLIPVLSEGMAGALESAGESGRLWEEEEACGLDSSFRGPRSLAEAPKELPG